jgi:RimJ/RimL family protein N-acetyltransferase
MKLLSPSEYPRVKALLKTVPINTLFARAVVERHVSGTVHVDDEWSPQVVYVTHPYGMSLLFGATDRERFNAALVAYLTGDIPRTGVEWLQVYPEEWSGTLESMLGDRLATAESGIEVAEARTVVRDVRINFRFDRRRYAELRETLTLPVDCELSDDADWIYRNMHGSVVPRAFWDTADAFRARGAAVALLHRGAIASTAFASFAIDHYLELGIETVDRFRGSGFAVHACAALVDRCLETGLEPVWSCRLSNQASYRLANRLGFDHVRSIPYYRLPR